MKILVVCTGNTCRSPMAGGLLQKMGSDIAVPLEVRTAGLSHHPNKAVAKNAVIVMKEVHIDISNEFSKPVTSEAVEWVYTTIFLQHDHADYFREEFPMAESKIRILERDVADPFCGPIGKYREVREDLAQQLSPFVRSIAE